MQRMQTFRVEVSSGRDWTKLCDVTCKRVRVTNLTGKDFEDLRNERRPYHEVYMFKLPKGEFPKLPPRLLAIYRKIISHFPVGTELAKVRATDLKKLLVNEPSNTRNAWRVMKESRKQLIYSDLLRLSIEDK